ncbi:hypothetical protein BOTBODRAFT_145938 [Botryobasidium botryosum FD-172 SS1]|uniref:Uncharacterized protein n=1 Tax=Botryobasidium botryosum (strain FD-172 SS1) TaxID=930990 RepID=A0A067MGA8_BOTB1|nr:hypothetical protein BOTBODRAFT_145938 [Botryobasidium botryosum FD-172 SS1]
MPQVVDVSFGGLTHPLYDTSAVFPDFHPVFASFPLLADLTIGNYSVLADAIIPTSGQVVCPLLQRLSLLENYIKPDRVVELVRARSRPSDAPKLNPKNSTHQLRRLTIKHCDNICDSLVQEIAPDVEYLFGPSSTGGPLGRIFSKIPQAMAGTIRDIILNGHVKLLVEGLVLKLKAKGIKKMKDEDVRDAMKKIAAERQVLAAARDEACGLIMAYTSAMLSDLGSKSNEMSPISCLPDEVLSLIFEAVCTGQNSLRSIPLNVAAVSRAWRGVALRTPRIWTAITMCYADLFIPRSKSVPLDIVVKAGCPDKAMAEYLALCIPHSDRWRSLDFCASEADVLIALSTAPMPKLQSLVVSWECRAWWPLGQTLEFQSCGVQASQLRNLDLKFLYLPLRSLDLSRLSRLRLTSIPVTPAAASPTRELLHSLDSSPNLEILQLDDIYRVSDKDQHDVPPVRLPRLREASFKYLSSHPLNAILTSVQFTTSPLITIELDINPNMATDWNSILPVVPNLSLIRKLEIKMARCSWRVRGRGSEGEQLLLVDCKLERSLDVTRAVNSLITFIKDHPIPHVVDLIIGGDGDNQPFHLPTFRPVFAAFPHLTDLVIGGWPALVDALIPTYDGAVCPLLQHLGIWSNPISTTKLMELVRARSQLLLFDASSPGSEPEARAGQLQDLTIVQCKNIPESLLPTLREIAPEIEYNWKGSPSL